MITVHSCPTIDLDGTLEVNASTFTLLLAARKPDPFWLNVEFDYHEFRRIVAKLVTARFAPHDRIIPPREARLAALLWFRDLLTNDCDLPPTQTPDRVEIVEPERNAGLSFEV